MKKITFELTAIFALATGLAYGQTTPSFSVGDTVAAATMERIAGYDPKKVMILDFGTTTCSPCLKSLKLLNALLPQFSEDLQVFFVTKEPTETVDRFLARSPVGKGMRIPILAADTALHYSFPHIAQPHSVWINRHGVVKAITDHHYINDKTLQALAEDADFSDWSVKSDYLYDARYRALGLNQQNFNEKTTPSRWYSSFISDHMPGMLTRWENTLIDSANRKAVVYAVNRPIAEIYASLYKLKWNLNFFPSHIVMDVANPKRYHYNDNGDGEYEAEWKKRNTYCFEMTFPLTLSEAERTERIIRQLNWYFNIEVELKTVKRKCWVLTPDKEKVKRNSSTQNDETGRGVTLYQLHTQINQLPDHLPMISELDGGTNTLMKITEAAYRDVDLLNKQLAPYGLIVNVEERELKTLLIREID